LLRDHRNKSQPREGNKSLNHHLYLSFKISNFYLG
jgi:hypothetical protein